MGSKGCSATRVRWARLTVRPLIVLQRQFKEGGDPVASGCALRRMHDVAELDPAFTHAGENPGSSDKRSCGARKGRARTAA